MLDFAVKSIKFLFYLLMYLIRSSVQLFLLLLVIGIGLGNPISIGIISLLGFIFRIPFLTVSLQSTWMAVSNLVNIIGVILFILLVFVAFRDAYFKCFLGLDVSNSRTNNAIWGIIGSIFDTISMFEAQREKMQQKVYKESLNKFKTLDRAERARLASEQIFNAEDYARRESNR
jgi:hypothetical protein